MLLINKEFENTKFKLDKIQFVKSFCTFEKEFTFNEFFNFADKLEYQLEIYGPKLKLKDFNKFSFGKQLNELWKNKLNLAKNIKIDTYVFASLTKLGISESHVDEETVFLIPAYGEVFYTLYLNEKEQLNYFLEVGDLLIIPKGIMHAAIPIKPRIVFSTGIFN